MRRRSISTCGALLLALPLAALAAEPLVPPPGFAVAAASRERPGHDCPLQAEPYTDTLDFPSKFEGSDKARDDLNRKAEAEYRRRIAPISAMEKGLSQQVEDYLRSGDQEALSCAIGLLERWSQARALEGPATTHTGRSMRKWPLASIAASYLRLQASTSQPLREVPATTQRVEAWIGRLAERVVDEWTEVPLHKMNNHEYWAAWSVMVSAVVLDRRDLFDWALKQYAIATAQIDAAGYLPNELKRDTRALYYHNYALTPLAMIAAFGHANGVRPSDEQRQALARLAQRVLAGIDNPQEFQRRTGRRQRTDELEQRSKLAWMEPYCWTLHCDPALQQKLAALRPLKSYRLGGNVTDLFALPLRPPA